MLDTFCTITFTLMVTIIGLLAFTFTAGYIVGLILF